MFQVTVWDYDRFGANEFLGKDLIWDLSLNISQTYLFCNSPSVLLAIKQHESKALSPAGRQLTVRASGSEYRARVRNLSIETMNPC